MYIFRNQKIDFLHPATWYALNFVQISLHPLV